MSEIAFVGAGRKLGIEIWRIEELKVVKWPEEQYGKFFTGDSYIVLHTQPLDGKSKFKYDIYFWLGATTSQDEMGIAAYKTVELDDYLGGGPVQHREVQGHESAQFLSVFKSGVQYMEGGIDSGFRKVEEVKVQRLLQVKGRRAARVRQVECAAASMNHGDVFVLDLGATMYQWNGKSCDKLEKAKALDVVTHIRKQERGGRAVIVILEDGRDDESAEAKAFWEVLGDKAAVKDADAGGDDLEFESSSAGVMYKVPDNGQGDIEKLHKQPLSKTMLRTEAVFVIDCESEFFIWVGTKSGKAPRTQANKYATQLMAANKRPAYTPITRVNERGETPLFKSKFVDWQEAVKFKELGQDEVTAGKNVAKSKQQEDIDAAKLHARAQVKETRMVDDGQGKLEVWRIEDFRRVEWPKAEYGQFFSGDSYVMLYTYGVAPHFSYIIYFWQGRDSTSDERGASALCAKEIDDGLGGVATQVRVVMGKEPNHFLTLFKGRMVIHAGGKASGFANSKETDKSSRDNDAVALYHVKGTDPMNTRAVQVATAASSLNSADCFILSSPAKQYVWNGKGAEDVEKSYAVAIGKIINSRNLPQEVVDEGKEDGGFWAALGGKAEYASSVQLQEDPRDPRLFQCSNASGTFKVEEIFNFSQDDLDKDDVFILDTYAEVFVWVGAGSNELERKMALQTAIEYVEKSKDGRDKDTPIYRINSGFEPPNFACHFLGWDIVLAKSTEDPFVRKMREAGLDVSAESARAALLQYSKKYPYDDLRSGPARAKLPREVNQAHLEKYLSEEEFLAVLGVSVEEYEKMPKWKQDGLKRKFDLF